MEFLPPYRLVRPAPEHRAAFLAMQADYQASDAPRYDEVYDYLLWLQQMENYQSGTNLPPNRVRQDTFFLMGSQEGMCILGVCRFRHELHGMLTQIGGHVGYDVPPSQRRKGYATRMLGLVLSHAQNCGFKRILVTCDTENIASAHVIQKNGGKLENEMFWPPTEKMVSRYWIDLETNA